MEYVAERGVPVGTTLKGMSNLIPEKRVDRNGRAVTRHILAPGATSEAKKPFPPVKPLGDRTNQVLAFQRLNFLIGDGTIEDLNRLFPFAESMAPVVDVCSKETIRDLYREALYEDEPDWAVTFATTCHFIAEAGGTRDPQAAQIAIHHAADHYDYGADELLDADAPTHQKIVEMVSALKESQFLDGVVGHGGSTDLDIKRNDLLNYLCSRIDEGTLQEAMPAVKDLDGFINFWDDEQAEPDVADNLDYIELIGLMEYSRKHTGISPDSVLSMVVAHHYKVDDVRHRIDSYEGFSALIDGSL